MPTLRLGDQERSEIRQSFNEILERSKNNQPFPLQDHDFPEFGYEMLPSNIAHHYAELREHGEFLTKASVWNPDFKIRDDAYQYDISISGDAVVVPKDGLILPTTYYKHQEILEWAASYIEVAEKVSDARGFLSGMVECCSSTGQIKRLLTDEVMRFLPNHMMEHFNNAERRSRIPAGMCMDGFAEKMDNLTQMLALGSLSPSERVGSVDASVSSRTPI